MKNKVTIREAMMAGEEGTMTPLMCPSRVRRSRPDSTSHTLSVLSFDPETTFPSGVMATAVTPFECPSKVRRSRPDSMSHTLSVLSSDPETTFCPSEVTATALTELVCPSSVRSNEPPGGVRAGTNGLSHHAGLRSNHRLHQHLNRRFFEREETTNKLARQLCLVVRQGVCRKVERISH